MDPYKKLHTNNNSSKLRFSDIHGLKTTSSSETKLQKLSLSKDSLDELSNSDSGKSKKIRKRRTLSETSKRDFKCGCGKSYVSYPAIYLHIQRKHESAMPFGTIIPEKPEAKDKVKRGRPKKEKMNMLDIANPEVEKKYKTEDDLFYFFGQKGSSSNEKTENKFINNLDSIRLEAHKCFPIDALNPIYYSSILKILEIIEVHPIYSPENIDKEIIKNGYTFEIDKRLAYMINWLCNPLRQEIFQEMCILFCFLRRIFLQDIWFEKIGIKQKIFHDENHIKEKLKESTKFHGGSKGKESLEYQIKNIYEKKRYPIYLEKHMIDNSLNQIVEYINNNLKDNSYSIFLKLVDQYLKSNEQNEIDELVEKILYYKDIDLSPEYKMIFKFNFLIKDNIDDLKELCILLCNWIICFDENDLKLTKIEDEYKIEEKIEFEEDSCSDN